MIKGLIKKRKNMNQEMITNPPYPANTNEAYEPPVIEMVEVEGGGEELLQISFAHPGDGDDWTTW